MLTTSVGGLTRLGAATCKPVCRVSRAIAKGKKYLLENEALGPVCGGPHPAQRHAELLLLDLPSPDIQ